MTTGDLGWHLGIVLRGYQARLEEALADMPCAIRGYQVLSAVVHREPPNQQALGAHLAIDRTVLTYLLDDMVAEGIVERVPAVEDRRARKIVATHKGREVLAHYEARVKTAETDLLSTLSESQAEMFERLLANLAAGLLETDPTGDPCEAVAKVTL